MTLMHSFLPRPLSMLPPARRWRGWSARTAATQLWRPPLATSSTCWVGGGGGEVSVWLGAAFPCTWPAAWHSQRFHLPLLRSARADADAAGAGAEPRAIAGTDLRCRGVSWGTGDFALLYEAEWKNRRSLTWVIAPDSEGAEKTVGGGVEAWRAGWAGRGCLQGQARLRRRRPTPLDPVLLPLPPAFPLL